MTSRDLGSCVRQGLNFGLYNLYFGIDNSNLNVVQREITLIGFKAKSKKNDADLI